MKDLTPILYLAHPFATSSNKDIYINLDGLAAITEIQQHCPSKDFFGLEHKIVTLAVTRSFTNNHLYKGRPVITSEDVKQACRLHGLDYVAPQPNTQAGALRAMTNKSFINYSEQAAEGQIDCSELKQAAENAATYEKEFLGR